MSRSRTSAYPGRRRNKPNAARECGGTEGGGNEFERFPPAPGDELPAGRESSKSYKDKINMTNKKMRYLDLQQTYSVTQYRATRRVLASLYAVFRKHNESAMNVSENVYTVEKSQQDILQHTSP